MLNIIWISRWLLFGAFIVSNAIICTVAVWNFFIAQAFNYTLQIDAFLIVVGAFALVFIAVIIVTGVVRKSSVATHVWFECLWVALFFILEFSGAVSLTILVPKLMCPPPPFPVSGSCSSTQILMAFTWIISICLLAYFLLLFVTALVHSKSDQRVWSRPIRHMGLLEMPESAAPPLPPSHTSRASHRRSLISIIAPRPRKVASSTLYVFSGGFGNDDGHSDPQRTKRRSFYRSSILPPLPVSAPPQRMVQRARESALPVGASLYPQNVQVAMAETYAARGQPSNAPTQQPQSQRPRPRPQQRSPPPLGDWPRADVLSQPIQGKPRRPSLNKQVSQLYAAPQSSLRTAPVTQTVMRVASPPPSAPPVSFSQLQRPRPSGPRTRSNSRDWSRPPPLDLTGINTYARLDRKI